MLLDQVSDYLSSLSDYMPALSTISPITVIGLGIVALCSLLYLFTRVPEYLLVIVTALLYAVAPLIH